MSRKHNTLIGLGLALLSSVTFGSSGSFARSLLAAGWSPAAAVTARVGTAALLLLIPTIVVMRGRWPELWRNAGMIISFGLVAVAGCQVFFFYAVQHVSVGIALLLEYLGTVLVVGWMWARHGHKPRRLTAIGSAVSLLGLVLVLDLIGDSSLDPVGIAWGLAAAGGLATYFILSAKTDSHLPPIALACSGMIVGSLALLTLGTLGAVPMSVSFTTVHFAGHQVSWLVPVLGLSVIAATVAYVAGIGASRRLGAKLAAFVGLTEVIFAVLIAWVLLDELPTSIQLGGGVVMVVGIVLVHIDELRPAAVALEPEEGPLLRPTAELAATR